MSLRNQLNRAERKRFQQLELEEAQLTVGAGYALRHAPLHQQIELFRMERRNDALRREIAARRARPVNGRYVYGRAMASLFLSVALVALMIYLPLCEAGREVRIAIATGIAQSKFDPRHPPKFDVMLADVPPAERTVKALLDRHAREIARLQSVGWRAIFDE